MSTLQCLVMLSRISNQLSPGTAPSSSMQLYATHSFISHPVGYTFTVAVNTHFCCPYLWLFTEIWLETSSLYISSNKWPQVTSFAYECFSWHTSHQSPHTQRHFCVSLHFFKGILPGDQAVVTCLGECLGAKARLALKELWWHLIARDSCFAQRTSRTT